ncbi:sulfotransferase family protein [Roseovarius salinarum]|uniref:sulfotransferase family protein n=1 Tax=Roseovarius salinarum TaxID=1981892 RepID=UPI000C348DB6|nr:sulfotransferase family protein [Roseovarius salinarum]
MPSAAPHETTTLRQSLTGELARNVIVSDTCRCVYVSTPKVASSSVKLALLRAERELSEVSERKIHDMARRHFKRPAREIAEILRDDRYYRFCIVRHPVDRFVSGFRNKLKRRDYRAEVLRQLGETKDRPVSIEEFVDVVTQQPDAERNRHWRSQTGLLHPGLFNYHTVAKIERLSEDWSGIADRLGLPCSLPRVNASGGKAKAVTISPRLRDRIAQIYQEDMTAFGYDLADASY